MPVLHRIDWACIGVAVLAVAFWGVHEWGVYRGKRLERVEWEAKELDAAHDGRDIERQLVQEQIAELGKVHAIITKSVVENRQQAAALRKLVDDWRANPVPVDIVRLLDAAGGGAGAADPAGAAGRAGAGTADPVSGPSAGEAVDAGILAEAVEENGARCGRNIERLQLCRKLYAEARSALIRFQRGAD